MTTLLFIIGALAYIFIGLTVYNFTVMNSNRSFLLVVSYTIVWPVFVLIYLTAVLVWSAIEKDFDLIPERYDLPRRLGEWLWRKINWGK
jgi:hypothetical protein